MNFLFQYFQLIMCYHLGTGYCFALMKVSNVDYRYKYTIPCRFARFIFKYLPRTKNKLSE